MSVTARYNDSEECVVIIHKTKNKEVMVRLDLNKREMDSLIKQLQKAVSKQTKKNNHDLFKM